MAQQNRILSDVLLRPVFKARALIHFFGVLVGVAVVIAGEAPPVMIGFAAVTFAVAIHQIRDCPVNQAWLVDNVYAIGIAVLADSVVAPAIVVGWAAVIGLVDTDERWFFQFGAALVGIATAVAVSMEGTTVTTLAISHGLAVGATAVFFVFAFRVVGRLLRANDRELRSFFERIPVALTRTAPDGRLLEFNLATAQLFDSPSVGEQVTARYVDPGVRREFVDILAKEGSLSSFEAQLRADRDRIIDAVISANAVTDEAGELRFIESAIFDFSSLRKLEAERERLARVIDSTSDSVAIADRDGTIRYANSAARRWLRRYVTDEQYVNLNQAVTEDDEQMLAKALREDRAWVGVLTIPTRGGTRTVSVALQVLEMGGERTIASISRDVTDEVETERQLKELIRAKDELVASISHEIRTPLSVVLGLASELRDRYTDFDVHTHREFASLIAEQGQEMANIVEDLLVAARADTDSIVLVSERVDLREEVEATLRTLSRGHNVTIEPDFARDCRGDANRIRQILRNLISNAQRYGGESVVISSRYHDGMVILEVADDGPGVPEDEIAAIFLPFSRAHTAGTQPASIGLGLSVARDLARRMGGDVTYRRTDSLTIFSLTIPGVAPTRTQPVDDPEGVRS